MQRRRELHSNRPVADWTSRLAQRCMLAQRIGIAKWSDVELDGIVCGGAEGQAWSERGANGRFQHHHALILPRITLGARKAEADESCKWCRLPPLRPSFKVPPVGRSEA